MTIDRPIATALILFVILLLVFFLVYPEYRTFKILQRDLGEKIAEFNAEFDYYSAIDRLYFELNANQDNIQKIDDALPGSEDSALGEIIYFLQGSAKDNALIIKNLFLSQSSLISNGNSATQGGRVRDIIFTMDLLGSYSSLGNFLFSLENSSRIFEIASISFGSAAKPPYTFSLQIKTHSY